MNFKQLWGGKKPIWGETFFITRTDENWRILNLSIKYLQLFAAQQQYETGFQAKVRADHWSGKKNKFESLHLGETKSRDSLGDPLEGGVGLATGRGGPETRLRGRIFQNHVASK